MIDNISSWVEQIIIAVIIATIIEMILPKGNSKKYIKIVIGIYILYTIISPIINIWVGGDLKIDYSKYNRYFSNTYEYKMLEEEFGKTTLKTIEITYEKEIKKQIRNDIEELGFNIKSIYVKFDLENGEIKEITLSVNKEKNKDNIISINKVEIGRTKNIALSEQELEQIKSVLNKKYNIDYENTHINSL